MCLEGRNVTCRSVIEFYNHVIILSYHTTEKYTHVSNLFFFWWSSGSSKLPGSLEAWQNAAQAAVGNFWPRRVLMLIKNGVCGTINTSVDLFRRSMLWMAASRLLTNKRGQLIIISEQLLIWKTSCYCFHRWVYLHCVHIFSHRPRICSMTWMTLVSLRPALQIFFLVLEPPHLPLPLPSSLHHTLDEPFTSHIAMRIYYLLYPPLSLTYSRSKNCPNVCAFWNDWYWVKEWHK